MLKRAGLLVAIGLLVVGVGALVYGADLQTDSHTVTVTMGVATYLEITGGNVDLGEINPVDNATEGTGASNSTCDLVYKSTKTGSQKIDASATISGTWFFSLKVSVGGGTITWTADAGFAALIASMVAPYETTSDITYTAWTTSWAHASTTSGVVTVEYKLLDV